MPADTGSIVSCTRGAGRLYYCFTDRYRVVTLKKLFKSRAPPPRPPSRLCGFPDTLASLGEILSDISPPCRITTPCVVYRAADGKPVEHASAEYCENCPPGMWCQPTWWVLSIMMSVVKSRAAVYRSVVFVGPRKAYVAPYTATPYIYYTMRALAEYGFLDAEFEERTLAKFGALTLDGVLAPERFGRIEGAGFNAYPRSDGSYEAVAMLWVESDRAARKYALFLWDVHREYVLPVLGILEELPLGKRMAVEAARDQLALGTPLASSPRVAVHYGFSVSEIPAILAEVQRENPLKMAPVDVEAVLDMVLGGGRRDAEGME